MVVGCTCHRPASATSSLVNVYIASFIFAGVKPQDAELFKFGLKFELIAVSLTLVWTIYMQLAIRPATIISNFQISCNIYCEAQLAQDCHISILRIK